MWCVRTRAGRFRSAVDRDGIVAWNLEAWRLLDLAAATEFIDQQDRERRNTQRAFIAATGLGDGVKLAASIREAHRLYSGGPYVTASHSSRV